MDGDGGAECSAVGELGRSFGMFEFGRIDESASLSQLRYPAKLRSISILQFANGRRPALSMTRLTVSQLDALQVVVVQPLNAEAKVPFREVIFTMAHYERSS